MDVQTVTTSLDALLHRATSAPGNEPDPLAIEAFCVVLKKENEGPYIASRLIASKMHSENLNTALLTLHVLETSMKKCGASFQAEIGKFKFLNEMVKLVSPKYLGNRTPQAIKDKVLLLMHSWTYDYPKEVKIREAYEMLQKQGVVKDDIPPLLPETKTMNQSNRTEARVTQNSQQKNKGANFEDEEKSKLLKKLLQSKNPDDLQAANRLIKTMVREDERRIEMKQRRVSDINTINNNVSLLNEMLEQYQPGITSEDELQIIKELYASCKQMQPKISRLAQETQEQDDTLSEVLHTSDELQQVFEKYKTIIEDGKTSAKGQNPINASLLDLGVLDNKQTSVSNESSNQNDNQSEIESVKPIDNIPHTNELLDIFSSVETNVGDSILQPLSVQKSDEGTASSQNTKKISAMDELDLLGENLLKSSLGENTRLQSFPKANEKIPMNLLIKPKDASDNGISKNEKEEELDLNILIGDCLKSMPTSEATSQLRPNDNSLSSVDDLMVDLSDTQIQK